MKNKIKQDHVRGTVKAAILKGDPDFPSLVATSVYDTKPVHFLSMVATTIEWIVKERLVYNKETDRQEVMRFLSLNVNNDSNCDMGHVENADQLRNYYLFDHCLRRFKWW